MNDTSSLSPSFPSRIWQGLQCNWRCFLDCLYAYRFELVILVLVGAVFLFPFVFYTIPAGHVGVLWKRFGEGTVTDTVYPEGYRLVFPWDTLQLYDMRLQKIEREVEVLSSDGLKITLQLVWRYRLNPKMVGYVHKYIGPDYSETLVTPTISARARDVISIYQPEEIYTERRLNIQNKILESVRHVLNEQFNPSGDKSNLLLVFEDVLIKGMELPAGVQEAIVRKNAMFHEMEEYTFRIQKENKEADRKRAEAAGIRHFQEIVSSGMSESYLRWRGIEATLELAKSPNAKIVVVGNPKNGLPLILNTDSKEIADSPPNLIKRADKNDKLH